MSLAAQRSGSTVRSGNYCCSSIRVASTDENKNKNSHRKIIMTYTQTTYINRITLRAGKKGAPPAEVGALASVFEKSATELKQQKLLKCKQTIQIATFDVRTLNRIVQPPELTALAVEYEIDITCITRTQIHAQRGYKISRYWQWMDASHCISMDKLDQCHGRKCRHIHRTKSVKIT